MDASNRAAALGLAYMLAEYGYPLAVPTGSLTPGQIWESSDNELTTLLKIPSASREKITSFRRKFDARAAFQYLNDAGIGLVALGEDAYPRLLSKIHDPPAGLFLAGGESDPSPIIKLHDLASCPCIAIVGARGASRYGVDAAEMIAEGLGRAGVCVISGMARGIDSAGHRGALKAGGGTIAVLGCGPDVIYPRSNIRIYHELVERGLVVSEYPPGTEPRPWRFPARNRIISGLSQGVVVVEARDKSGALITADFCLDEGREVWAVPGSIFSDLCTGPHGLLRLGASAVTSPADILNDLGITMPDDSATEVARKAAMTKTLTPDEQLVFSLLDVRPALPEQIAARAPLESCRIAAALITLELKGVARNDPVRGYSR